MRTPTLTQEEQQSAAAKGGAGLGFVLAGALLATFALITLGGTVRVTGSGLGCPDWPLCHGRLIPPLEFHALLEYAHRLSASLVSALVILGAILAWWRYRSQGPLVRFTTLALAFLGFQVVLGGITVLAELPPTIVTVHLITAQITLGLLVVSLVLAGGGRGGARWAGGSLYGWAWSATLGMLFVMLSGSYVVGAGATAACLSWPLCQEGLLPWGELAWIHMAHRLLVVGLIAPVGWTVVLGWRRGSQDRLLAWLSGSVAALLLVQILVGAANPLLRFPPELRVLHLSLATALWGSLVALTALVRWPAAGMSIPLPELHRWQPKAGVSWLERVAAYIELTKPRIMSLLLVTALGGMILAAEGLPPLSLILAVLVGGALASGGASAMNHCLEQDLDQKMRRTQRRPVASGRIPGMHALVLGLVLNLLAFLVLWSAASPASALLALAGSGFYILVYTRWLKRSTAQNIVIGGAAGAVAPLVGWAAVTGGLALPALYLFAIVFFWTPPHFWALALRWQGDYALAGVPMLPVVAGERWTRWAIFLYILMLNAITLLFFLTTPSLGPLFLGGSVLLGSTFLFLSLQLLQHPQAPFALRLYWYSLLYLALLFLLVMADGVW